MQVELYGKLGFKKNPFSTFSAEEEAEFLRDVFIKPLYFTSIESEIKDGHSRFILGARGIGKTALILNLKANIDSQNVFSVIIDEFDGIPLKNNKSKFLCVVLECLIRDYCCTLAKQPSLMQKLDEVEKEKLAFIIKEFFKTISRKEYEKYYDKASNYKTRNAMKRVWNSIFNKPINYFISGGVELVSDTVRKSLGLPDTNTINFYKNYLPEMKLEEIEREKKSKTLYSDSKVVKDVLNDFAEIVIKSGLGKPVIFFDKIDEYSLLNSSIKNISEFLEEILKDTALLLNSNISLVFSLWDAIKPELSSRGVRFDKIKPLDITWSKENIKNILDKRFAYFSDNTIKHDVLIKDTHDYEDIIDLASYSPRYLFRLLSVIYDQQNNINHDATYFERDSIKEGMKIFSTNFEFYAAFPGKRGTKEDIVTNINRLLRVGKKEVKSSDFIDVFKVSTPTAISYITMIKEYGFLMDSVTSDGKAKIYNVVNPIILNLIENNITEVRK